MNSLSDFEQAVVKTIAYISDGLSDGFAPDSSQEFVIVAGEAEFKLSLLGMTYLEQQPSILFSWAASDADGLFAAKFAIAQRLDRGQSLPSEATDWLIRYLRGEIPTPKARRGPKSAEWKNALILNAIQRLVLDGYIATRNDVTDPKENPSACDIVACAMAELDLEPSKFDAVKQLWKDRKNLKLQYLEPG